jgi:hypothetical protein
MPGLPIAPVDEPFEKVKGPVFAFYDVIAPAQGAKLTLALDPSGGFKTPDATQNPDGFALGCTNEGWKFNSEFSETEEFCDESTVAEFTAIEKEGYTVEAGLRNPLNSVTMQRLFGATMEDGTGFKVFRGGGFTGVAEAPLVFVFRNPEDPTKYGYLLFYRAKLTSAFNLDQMTSKKTSAALVRFRALADTSRPPGQQVWQVYYDE